MQLPIDIGAVLDEATNVDAARRTPISLSIYIDESAPGDLQAYVRQAFASASTTARVSISYLEGRDVVPYEGDDMACIVAGTRESSGYAASVLRQAGIPVMVVTTSPTLTNKAAAQSKYPFPKGDVISPSSLSVSKDVAAQVSSAASDGSAGSVQASTDTVAKSSSAALSAAPSEPVPLGTEAAANLLERMGAWVIDACKEKRLAFALAFPFVRKPLAMETVKATSMQNGGIGLVLVIPGADMPVMTLNQAKMVLQIAAAYGEELSMSRAKELAAVVAGGFACRGVARQICSAIPVAGWAVKAAIGYSGTYAMGRAAIEFYEGGPTVSKLTDVIAQARDKAVASAARKAASSAQKAGANALSGVRAKASSAAASAKQAASAAANRVRNENV